MKKTQILYWTFTGLLCALMLFSSIPDILFDPEAVNMITNHLGYPLYFLPFIGVAKVLGVVALLVPGYPRLKEWAYAGFSFDLIAATFSFISVGDPPSSWMFMSIGLALVALSYYYHHKRRKLLYNDPVLLPTT